MGIPLHEPQITSADEAIVLEALRSQWVSTGGPFIGKFESQFAAFTGFQHAVSVCNGTLGLVLALEVVKRKRGIAGSYYVLVPTLSFAATWNSVIEAGGIPIPVDCSAEHVNMDVSALQRSIENLFVKKGSELVHRDDGRPLLAVLPAHILGWAGDMDAIRTICVSAGLSLIEDAAESLGSRYLDGKHLGHHGDCAVFSFNGNKILTTGGGGMLVTNDAAFAQRAKHLATTAKTDNLRFVHDEPGFNYRMVNVLAALGVSQLARLSENLARKQLIANLYKQSLSQTKATLYEQKNCKPNNWINTVVFESSDLRERSLEKLQNAGYDCRPLWTPFHRLTYCKLGTLSLTDFQNAEMFWSRLLSVPSSPQLEERQVLEICDIIKAAV